MIVKSIAARLSPRGGAARLSILIFHRVLSRVDPLFPGEQDTTRFDQTLSWLARWFQVLPLDEAVSQLRAGTLPERAAVITFDDGYADNATNALPILKRHGMTATFFVATSFLDGGRMWNDSVIEAVRAFRGNALDLSACGLGSFDMSSNDQRRATLDVLLGRIKYLEPSKRQDAVDWVTECSGAPLPNDLMMRSDQVLELRQSGMQIGAHTCSHPILDKISDSQAQTEISDGKVVLESLLDEPVTLFAYPNGKPAVDYSQRHVDMVRRAGFIAAVSTSHGVSSQTSDILQLPRFTPWDRTSFKFGVRLLLNLRQTPRYTELRRVGTGNEKSV